MCPEMHFEIFMKEDACKEQMEGKELGWKCNKPNKSRPLSPFLVGD